MKIITLRTVLVVLVLVICLAGGLLLNRSWSENDQIEVIVINKSNYDFSEFWMAVLAGIKEAAQEYDLEVSFMNAQQENEIDQQKAVIEAAIQVKPDVIVLAASDYYEIGPYAEAIVSAGIKLILMDSDVNMANKDQVPFVGTNSLKAGGFLGELAKTNGQASDRAILLAHYSGVKTSDDREAGIKEGYGSERILHTYSCDSDADIAYALTKKMLLSDEPVNVVFATNENVTVGAAKAIDELGLIDDVALYGFDHSKKHIEYLEQGVIDYTVIQSPYQIGYLSIVNALELVRGNKVEAFIETDYLPISIDNMYEVGFREILFPFGNN